MGWDWASWIIVRMNDVEAMRSTVDPAIGVPSFRVHPSARTCSTTSVATLVPPRLNRATKASARCWASDGCVVDGCVVDGCVVDGGEDASVDAL